MFNRIVSFILLAMAIIGLLMPVNAATGDDVVILTANWCANCRRILPVVQQASQQQGLTPVFIDVDSPEAPKMAKDYGIKIHGKSLPVVYVVRQGQAVEVLNGKTYTYGQDDAIRGAILTRLRG